MLFRRSFGYPSSRWHRYVQLSALLLAGVTTAFVMVPWLATPSKPTAPSQPTPIATAGKKAPATHADPYHFALPIFAFSPPDYDWATHCRPSLLSSLRPASGKHNVSDKERYRQARLFVYGNAHTAPDLPRAETLLKTLTGNPHSHYAPHARVLYATLKLTHRDIARDAPTALQWLEEALPQLPKRAGEIVGDYHFAQRDYTAARRLYHIAATAGSAHAALMLARLSPDSESAASLLQLAQNNALEQLGRGDCHLAYTIAEWLTQPRHAQPVYAKEWLQAAAKAKHPAALFTLGLRHGDDTASAHALWQKAAAAGYRPAMHALAFAPQADVKWLHKAAEYGDRRAIRSLIDQYQGKHSGHPANPELAVFWLQRAAQSASASPALLYRLATAYADGMGVAASPSKALDLYQRAAQQGHAASLRRIAGYYLRGEIVTADLAQWESYLRRAADAGDTQAMLELGNAYAVGLLPHNTALPDNHNAQKWWQNAATTGNPEAHALLANRAKLQE